MIKNVSKEWLENVLNKVLELINNIPYFCINLDDDELDWKYRQFISEFKYDDEKKEYFREMNLDRGEVSIQHLGKNENEAALNLVKSLIFHEAYNYYGPDHYMDFSDPKHPKIFKGVDPYEIMENRVKFCNEIVEKAFENMR